MNRGLVLATLRIGFALVLVYSVAILVGMLLFIYAIVRIGNAMAARRPSAV